MSYESSPRVIETDVLVIGGGTAGPMAAVTAKERDPQLRVLLLEKANVKRSGAAELDMRGVQDPPPGYLYEAWIIPANGQPIPVGTTTAGNAQLALNGVSSGTTVAITQERSRVDAPTSAPIMAVVVQS